MKEKIFLATPGPVNIPKQVFNEMGGVFYHRNQDFSELCMECTHQLSLFFDCPNEPVMISSSGTGAMETTLINTLSPNDKVICITCGKFSERFIDIAHAFNCEVIIISSPYGTAPDPDLLRKTLKKHPDVKAVTVCHCETSTCVITPIAQYAEIIQSTDAIFIVDAISTAGVTSINQQKLNIDLCIGAGHKGFMTPPVISFISYYGDKIQPAFQRSLLPKFYFNLKKEIQTQKKGFSMWTPSINNILALKKSLSLMIDEGIDNIYCRHQTLSSYTLNRGKDLNIAPIVQKGEIPSPSVTGFSVNNPDQVIQKMKDRGILIAGGQGSLSSSLIRIGHLGQTSLDEMEWIMDTLAECL